MNMYKLGNPVTFNTATGQRTGLLLNVDAFPLIDFVSLNDGFITTAFELATGLEVMNSQCFTIDDFVSDMVIAMKNKGFNDSTFFKKLQSDTDLRKWGVRGLEVVNESPSYNNWLLSEKQRIDNLPLLYTTDEIAQLDTIIIKAHKYGLTDFARMLECDKVKKLEKGMIKSDLAFLEIHLEDLRLEKIYDDLKADGKPLPKGVNQIKQPYDLSWQGMIDYLHSGRKRLLTKYIPDAVLQKFFKVYVMCASINMDYGYYRFRFDDGSLLRIAIDNKKERNIDASVSKFDNYLNRIIEEIDNLK